MIKDIEENKSSYSKVFEADDKKSFEYFLLQKGFYTIYLTDTKNADTRTASHEVQQTELYNLSKIHITEVQEILAEIIDQLQLIAKKHDYDKLNSTSFYNAFHNHQLGTQNFEDSDWYKKHYSSERHLTVTTSDDVNLLDILEMIADAISSGKGRGRDVASELKLSPEVLQKAFNNTVDWVDSITISP